jgi:hypothetical protein
VLKWRCVKVALQKTGRIFREFSRNFHKTKNEEFDTLSKDKHNSYETHTKLSRNSYETLTHNGIHAIRRTSAQGILGRRGSHV